MQHSVTFHYIREICGKFGIAHLRECPDIRQNSGGVISDFRISSQSFIKEICHNSRTSNDNEMKLGPITKLNKRNMAMSKNLTMTSCRQIVSSLSFFQFMAKFGAIRKPDCGRMVCKSDIFINNNLTKTENRSKK